MLYPGHSLWGGGLTPLQRCSQCFLQSPIQLVSLAFTPSRHCVKLYEFLGWSIALYLYLTYHMEIRHDWEDETQFFPSSGRIDTAVWMHHLTLTKRLEKKLDGNYSRMLRAILNKSWQQHPRKYQLYGYLPPITKTIQVRRTRHEGHCWRSRDELISDVLLCTPTYGRARVWRPARTYIQQLFEDTGCSPEDLPEAMND